MDIRQLEHFLAVVDAGGFSAAARRVHVSQPALSAAVRQLERELGTPLFARVGRRSVLTAAGEALVGPARRALQDVATGRAAVAAVAGLEGGRLTLASLPTLAADPLAGLVGRFRSAHPAVRLELADPDDSAELADLVAGGRVELGLGVAGDGPPRPDLQARPVGRQRLVVIFPPGAGPPGTGRGLALGALAGVPLVATPPGTSSRRLLEEGLARAGVVPEVAVVTAQREAVLPLVLAGAGAALVPDALGSAAEALGAVLVRPRPALTRELVALCRPGPLAPAAQAFLALAAGG
jgi:DNA-binding transcriptional LysR family regulator